MYKTIEQIHREYDGQWFFLIHCKEGENNSVAGGEVAISSERRDKVLREMQQYRHEKSDTFIFYAGKIPEESFSIGVIGLNVLSQFDINILFSKKIIELIKIEN